MANSLPLAGGRTLGAIDMRSPLFLGVVLAICLCAILLARPKTKSDPLFLHIFSNRYDIHSMGSDLAHPPRPYQCIATIGFHSARSFFTDIPNHYEPEIQIEGVIVSRGNLLDTDFRLWIQDVGIAFEHKQDQPISLNQLEPFGYDKEFYFAVSDTKNQPAPPSTTTIETNNSDR